MRGNLVGALALGILSGLIAGAATLAAGRGFPMALLAYGGAGSLGLVGTALLGAAQRAPERPGHVEARGRQTATSEAAHRQRRPLPQHDPSRAREAPGPVAAFDPVRLAIENPGQHDH